MNKIASGFLNHAVEATEGVAQDNIKEELTIINAIIKAGECPVCEAEVAPVTPTEVEPVAPTTISLPVFTSKPQPVTASEYNTLAQIPLDADAGDKVPFSCDLVDENSFVQWVNYKGGDEGVLYLMKAKKDTVNGKEVVASSMHVIRRTADNKGWWGFK